MKKLFAAFGLMLMSSVVVAADDIPAGYEVAPAPDNMTRVLVNKTTGGTIVQMVTPVDAKQSALAIAQKTAQEKNCADSAEISGDDDMATVENCSIEGASQNFMFVSRDQMVMTLMINDKVTQDEVTGMIQEMMAQ